MEVGPVGGRGGYEQKPACTKAAERGCSLSVRRSFLFSCVICRGVKISCSGRRYPRNLCFIGDCPRGSDTPAVRPFLRPFH